MKTLFSLISAVVLLSQQNIASACPEGHGGHGLKARFNELDVNKDASLSREEVKDKGPMAEKFEDIDTNKDSLLTVEELKAHRKAHRGSRPSTNPAE